MIIQYSKIKSILSINNFLFRAIDCNCDTMQTYTISCYIRQFSYTWYEILNRSIRNIYQFLRCIFPFALPTYFLVILLLPSNLKFQPMRKSTSFSKNSKTTKNISPFTSNKTCTHFKRYEQFLYTPLSKFGKIWCSLIAYFII